MKHFSYLLLLLLFVSCQKDEGPPSFSCKIDGADFNPHGSLILRDVYGDKFYIIRFDNDTLNLNFYIDAYGEGIYDLSPKSKSYVIYKKINDSNEVIYSSKNPGSTGVFSINNLSGIQHKNIDGEFGFTIYSDDSQKITFSNGVLHNFPYIKRKN